MRWSIIRLIWVRELRDQLRDRRTLFMIAVLPVFLYPLAGILMSQLFGGFFRQESPVRIVGSRYLPPWSPRFQPTVRAATWLSFVTPPAPGAPLAGIDRLVCAVALQNATSLEYAPLLDRSGARASFLGSYYEGGGERNYFKLELVDYPDSFDPEHYLDSVDTADLKSRKVDLILVVPPNFTKQLAEGERPLLHFLDRDKDDRSRLAANRLSGILSRWKQSLKRTRLLRQGLPADFDDSFELRSRGDGKSPSDQASDELSKMLAQVFPFVLVMWSLAGALYPAVDVCAGEKERGTMETLLISPASREEIVWGKFLTIWVFSAATALLNLLSMGITTYVFTRIGGLHTFRLSFLVWGAILLLPLSAFFSAMCLSVGVYARSSKEGQYYLMPLFLLTMPLVCLTLVPGVDLNHFYSMVPVTGVALLLKALMKTGEDRSPWMYFVPVLAPMVIYSWLALRWAIEQFQREEVLFREAERLDIGLWLKRLFREKDLLPSTGQALFCFLIVLMLHWVTLSAFARQPSLTLLTVGYFVSVTVPLFMVLMLTKRPAAGLGLRSPPHWSWPLAVLLAVLLFLPGMALTHFILKQFPAISDSLKASQPLLRDGATESVTDVSWGALLFASLGVALVQAVFEELTFRGFILNGLRRRFRPWMAIFLSAFLFAVFQMNVFQCVPHFLLGAVLGFIAWRSGSVLPAIVLHFVYNGLVYLLLIVSGTRPQMLGALLAADGTLSPFALIMGGASAVAGAAALVGMSYLRKRPDAVEAFAEGASKKY